MHFKSFQNVGRRTDPHLSLVNKSGTQGQGHWPDFADVQTGAQEETGLPRGGRVAILPTPWPCPGKTFALHLVPRLTYSAGSARGAGCHRPGLSTLKRAEYPAAGLQGDRAEAHGSRPTWKAAMRSAERETQSNQVHLGLGINHLPNTV